MNRAQRNWGHRTMNWLRREGRPHASEKPPHPLPVETHHRLYVADIADVLPQLPDGSAQLVICDPPYNLRLADWDRHTDYLAWAKTWLDQCQRILTTNGSLVIFGGLQYQNDHGGDLLEIMHYLRHQSALKLVNLIVWNYPNGTSAHRFFANRHEEIAWYVKGKDYVFNLDAVRERFDAATQARYARDRRLRPESLAKGKNPTNVWRIGRLTANARQRTGHPTQKPRQLIERLILALSHPGQCVLDPFAGSAVTTRIATQHARHSIIIDSDPCLPKYLDHQLRDLPPNGIPFSIRVESLPLPRP